MSKFIVFIGLLTFLLTGCGTEPSWEEEKNIEVSDRIITEDVTVQWELDDHQASKKGTLIRLTVKNQDQPIESFDVNHEKLLHLIIVSKDLSYFNHVHPEYKGDGVFEITNDFPSGGEYRMVADFKPTDGSSMSKMEWVKVGGEIPKPTAVAEDSTLEKSVDGKKVSLTVESDFEAGKELTFNVYTK
ncbi:hypothetical protein [Bacillus dakarensis]|uniref:hypothetical protein n=1 Tax=Robertmurraya dakarensis TaxID=1926278 RepID=UPI001F37F71D|nr:hypothetical protein [Bacillus dakarensis]